MKNMRRILKLLFAAVSMTVVIGCAGKKGDATATVTHGDTLIHHARLLEMERLADYVKVDIKNPWDSASTLAKYALVEKGSELDSLPEGYTRIDIPLAHTLVYSSVHTGVLKELGALNALAAVADGNYVTDATVRAMINKGDVSDVGSSTSPALEKIMALKPDAILLSPFENAGHGVLDALGVPIIECADYMESTPLGRAEWIKLLGVLFGCEHRADSIFKAVCASYNELKDEIATCESRPLVLTEKLTSGYWFVPGGESYMARLIADAGGRYPWDGNKNTGSLQLDFSAVYARAADADVWLIKTFGSNLKLSDLRSEYILNSQLKAFRQGNVYVANTAVVPLFDEFPFHPELLLREYVAIFHPEKGLNPLRYYKKAQ